MASKTNLGGVFLTDLDNQITSDVVASTEAVGGIIFDTALVGGLAAALGAGTAATTFANGNVVELNSIDDMKAAGIDETVMLGLPKKHLDDFFTLAGNGHRLFVSFMDSTTDADFTAVEKMQVAAGGIIDHIGVWTSKPISAREDVYTKVANPTGNPSTNGYYKLSGTSYVAASETEVAANTDYYLKSTVLAVPDDNVLKKLELQAEILGGKCGVTNYDGNAPVVIVLNAPIADEVEIDYRELPDLTAYDFPKVAMMIGQSASSATHALQLKLIDQTNATFVQVGNIGAALACLAVAPANESIAHVAHFNLANVTTTAELGFGNLVVTGTAGARTWGAAAAYTNINTLSYQKRNQYLHKKGYCFLTTYDGLENAVFFSSDQTLSQGDYCKISRVRVINKSRRAVRRALLPYVHDDWDVNAATGELSQVSLSIIQDIVVRALNANMVEPGTNNAQISGKKVNIPAGQSILTDDALNITYALTPRGETGIFNVTEGFALTNA